MKKASIFAIPLFAFIFSVAILNFLPVSRSSAMLIALLGFPAAILTSYFLWGKRDIKSGLAGWALATALCSFSLLALYLLRSGTFFAPDISLVHFAGVVALALSAGILEEFFFRGLLLGLLMKYFSRLPVFILLALQALLFSAWHLDKTPLFYVQAFAAGLFFGWTVLKTKSLWFAIGFHFGWDLMMVFLFGYHSRNFGHLKSVIIFAPQYAYAEHLIFVLALGIAAFLFTKMTRQMPRAQHAG